MKKFNNQILKVNTVLIGPQAAADAALDGQKVSVV